MTRVMDVVFLAIVADAAAPSARSHAARERLVVSAILLASALIVAVQPVRLPALLAQLYIVGAITGLELSRAAGWLPAGDRCERGGELASLMILGLAPLEQSSVSEALLHAAWAGTGWFCVASLLDLFAEEASDEGLPAAVQGSAGRLLVAGLIYWALMGFFNAGWTAAAPARPPAERSRAVSETSFG